MSTERDAFEAWAMQHKFDCEQGAYGYKDLATRRAWLAWEARAEKSKPRYEPLADAEVEYLTSMVWGAPASDDWIKGAAIPLIRQYELCRAAGLRPKDPCDERMIAPWPDMNGNTLRVGTVLVHPADGSEAIVAYDETQVGSGKWRAIYQDGTSSALGLQIGSKGQAVVKDVAL